jgi:hypothetical protein
MMLEALDMKKSQLEQVVLLTSLYSRKYYLSSGFQDCKIAQLQVLKEFLEQMKMNKKVV